MRNPELHAAVLASPDDDAPRLVYADWLSERGSPRGELIALQIEREKVDREDPRWLELYRREWELRDAHQAIFKAPYKNAFIEYRRGFVEHVQGMPGLIGQLDLSNACVRELKLFGAWISRDDLAHLLGLPGLERVERFMSYALNLQLEHVSVLAGFARIALDSEPPPTIEHVLRRFAPLRELELDNCRFTGGFAPHVMRPALAPLEVLGLQGSEITDRDVTAIIDSKLALHTLRLSRNAGITTASAERIASEPRFASLRELTLGDTSIGPEGFAALQASPYLPRGMELGLDGKLLGLEIEYDFNDQGRAIDASWKQPPKSDRFRIRVEGRPAW